MIKNLLAFCYGAGPWLTQMPHKNLGLMTLKKAGSELESPVSCPRVEVRFFTPPLHFH